MASRTVTGTVKHPDGSAWSGGEVIFYLASAFETATEVYPVERFIETLDGAGQFSITLGVPDSGTAQYQIQLPDKAVSYTVYIASGAPTTLESLLTIATQAVAQNAVQTLIDANNVMTIRNVNQQDAIVDTDEVVRCNGTFTVTLPAATGSGAAYLVKNIGVGVITLARAGADTIDGATSQSIPTLASIAVLDAAAGIWDIL